MVKLSSFFLTLPLPLSNILLIFLPCQVSDREQPELSERPHVCPRTEQQEDQVTQRTEQKEDQVSQRTDQQVDQVTHRTEHQRVQITPRTYHQGAHVTPRRDPQVDQLKSRREPQGVQVTLRTEHHVAQATLRTEYHVAHVPPRAEQQVDKVNRRPETEGVQVTQGTECQVAQISPRTEKQLAPVNKTTEHHVAQVVQRTKHQEAPVAQGTEHESQVTQRTEHQETQVPHGTEYKGVQVSAKIEHEAVQVTHKTQLIDNPLEVVGQCVREPPEADLSKPKERNEGAKCSSQAATEGKAKLLSRIFKSHTPQKPSTISIKSQEEVPKEREMRRKLEDVVDEIELQSLGENVKENTSKKTEGKPNTVLIHRNLLPVPAEITVPNNIKNATKLLIKKKKLLKCCYCRKRFIYANRMRLHKKQKHPFKALLAMNKTPEHMLRDDFDIVSSNISSYKFNEKTAALCDPLTDHSDDNLNDLDDHDDVDTDPYEGMDIKPFEPKLHKREGEKVTDKTEAKEKFDKDEEEAAKMRKSRALSILNYRAKRERMRKGKQGQNIPAKKMKVRRKKVRQELCTSTTLGVTLEAQENSETNKPPLPMMDTVGNNSDESDKDLLIVDEDVKEYDEKTNVFVQPTHTSHGLSNTEVGGDEQHLKGNKSLSTFCNVCIYLH